MKRENKEARTCQLMILALIMCLMMLSQFFSIYCEITKEPIPSWIIALSGYTYFTSQISILVYCWSVSGRITSQSNDQTLRNLEEKLQQDILHEINNEFVRLFKDQEVLKNLDDQEKGTNNLKTSVVGDLTEAESDDEEKDEAVNKKVNDLIQSSKNKTEPSDQSKAQYHSLARKKIAKVQSEMSGPKVKNRESSFQNE